MTDGADRLLIIGWDGADWDILDPLIQGGYLPNVAEMVGSGARGVLMSSVPYNSWVAWTSFLTGMNPGGHGVFDFVERRPDQRGRRVPVTSRSIGAATFLEILSTAGVEIRAANIPSTFPPFPVLGRMIGGVAIPRGARFVYPAQWAAELERTAPFPVNGMEWTRFRGRPGALVSEARSYVQRRTASFEALLMGDWALAVCVYVAPDRMQHPFGDRLLPAHPDYAAT